MRCQWIPIISKKSSCDQNNLLEEDGAQSKDRKRVEDYNPPSKAREVIKNKQ